MAIIILNMINNQNGIYFAVIQEFQDQFKGPGERHEP